MKFRRVLVCGLLAAALVTVSPEPAPAASKEIQELQRDVAALQDMVKALQRSQDEKLATLSERVQQALTSANDTSRAVAVIQSGFQQSLKDQESKVVTPVVSLGTRMDQVSGDVRTLSQAISDLTGMISKIQAQLSDLNNAVRVMQAPPAPAPSTAPSGALPGTTPGGGDPGTPPMAQGPLYENARRDYLGGKYDLAVQEFSDYLKWYGNTDYAPNAQFYIAAIHAAQGDLDAAVREFDVVLEKYPDNNKTPDALFGKGQALVKMGRRTDGGREFQELIKRFPKSELAPKACEQLKSLGLNSSCGSRAAASKGGKKSKK